MAESFIAALSEREDNHYILVHYGRSKDPESGWTPVEYIATIS